MSPKKKAILFTYTEYTASSTVALMKRLLAMFPKEQFDPHLLLLSGSRPDKVLQDYIRSNSLTLYLHFNFDCLGFSFSSFDESPFYNTMWTPCVTYLTVPASKLHRELSREMNLNITLLCMTKAEEAYIRGHYPQYEDVRVVANPLLAIQPLYSTLLSISDRYPLI